MVYNLSSNANKGGEDKTTGVATSRSFALLSLYITSGERFSMNDHTGACSTDDVMYSASNITTSTGSLDHAWITIESTVDIHSFSRLLPTQSPPHLYKNSNLLASGMDWFAWKCTVHESNAILLHRYEQEWGIFHTFQAACEYQNSLVATVRETKILFLSKMYNRVTFIMSYTHLLGNLAILFLLFIICRYGSGKCSAEKRQALTREERV
jgi:hypothetical protein